MNRRINRTYMPQQGQMINGSKPLHRTTLIRGENIAMRYIKKSTTIALLATLVLVMFGFIQPVMAESGTPGPASGDGIVPVFVDGNPSCATMNADNTNFPNVTSDFGFKLNLVPEGTFTLTNSDGELTGGAPSDPANSVTISNKQDNYFDWSATLGIDAVIVKGGDNADAYIYVPEDTADTDLHAPINPSNNKPFGLSHVEFCYDYEPLVPFTASKTAVGSYDRTITWQLEKTVDPASHTGNVGENAGSSTWTVAVTKTVTLGNYQVNGSITISNSNDSAASFTVSDLLSDGTAATVTCPGTNNNTGTVSANGQVVCTYTASPTGATATKNTATITSNTSGIDGAVAEAPVSFSPNVIGDETVTVDDDRDTEGQFPQNISETTTFDYEELFTCSSEPSDYAQGVDSDEYPNTATVTGDNTNLSDDAKVTVTCYAPVVSKDAEALHKQKYTWTITKDADGEYTKFIGDPATTHNYTVTVDQTLDESFTVSGTITVFNPRPDAAMSVSLVDVVAGIPATLSCSNPLNVPAAGNATCDYTVQLQSATDGTNIATATLNNVDFEASAAYVFGAPDVDGFASIDVTDTNGEQWEDITSDESFEYTKGFSCPTDLELYDEGVYVATDHVNTATINETGQYDTATVKLTCYAPVVTKNAEASREVTHTWSIDKEADAAYVKFIGDPATTHNYTVTVDQSVEQRAVVSGTITVANPHPTQPIVVALEDVVGGVPATLSCGSSLNVPAAGSATCDYFVELPDAIDGTNVATVTFNNINFAASALYVFGEPLVNGFPSIDVTDTNTDGWQDITGDESFEYTKDFSCPTDTSLYVDGIYVAPDHINTATIVETGQNDIATVKLTCYAPVVTKDAQASHGAAYSWTITKDADGTYSKFIGDPATMHPYTVTVDQSVEQAFIVSGTISVNNPRPDAPMSVSLEDVVQGVPATLACSNPLNVAANSTATCDYSVALPSDIDGTNIVTATFNSIDFEASAAYEFGDPEVFGSSTITVTDTNGEQWTNITSDQTFTYEEPFTCPTDISLYVNGIYIAADYVNTATIVETGQSDTATVKLTCYAPVVEKEAQAEWLREYAWEITKTVEPSSHSGYPGDNFTSTYSVTVNQIITESGFKAFGVISVTNPAGSPGPMSVDVTDEISGSVALVDCDALSEGNQGTLAVQPGESESCAYTLDLADATDRTNTATATFQQIAFTTTAAVDFGDPLIVGNPTINVVDFFDGAVEGEPLGSPSEETTFTYSRPFECPVEQEAYSNGLFERLFPNVARIIETEQQDDASVTITCELRAGLGDYVWFDRNQNGQQDANEPGISGVIVELLQNGSVISTTTTNSDGFYSFTGLLAGTYAVRFPITGLTTPEQGDDATDSDALLTTGLVTTTLEAGEFDSTLDAGYIPASLGDFVWEDTNSNGIQESGEPAVPAVTVRLLQGGNVISTTVTDGTGHYLFENLQPGEYVVCFVLPEDYDFTAPNRGDDNDEDDSDAIPSDSDPTIGCTEIITLEFGDVDLTWDVGLVQTEPTAEEEVDQPVNPQQLFLPTLRNSLDGSAAAQSSSVAPEQDDPAGSVYLPTTSK